MDKVYGVTMLVIGGACLWGAVHVLHAKKAGKRAAGWHEAVILLLVAAGLGIGGALSLLLRLDFLYTRVGMVPLWLVLALAAGIWFLVDLVARRGWTRTSILAFLTAALIAVPIAPPALAAATHGHAPHLISVTHKG